MAKNDRKVIFTLNAEPLDLVWGASAIAAVLNLKSRRKVFYMLETGKIPARKVGREWVASRETLRKHFESLSDEAAA